MCNYSLNYSVKHFYFEEVERFRSEWIPEVIWQENRSCSTTVQKYQPSCVFVDLAFPDWWSSKYFSTCFTSVAGYWWLMVAHSFQLGILMWKKPLSHWACHQSDNSQIKSVLQTVLITHNGFAGCLSHSVFCQINGITSLRLRNMEAIRVRGVIWLPFKISLMLQMGERLKQMSVRVKSRLSSHLLPSLRIKWIFLK